MTQVTRHSSEIERFEARISAKKKNILKNAADLCGRSLSDFVIHSAYEAAVHIIQEYQLLHLSAKDRDVFIDALLNPSAPSAKLLKAAKSYKKHVISKD